jgi:hypothetical protein
MRHCGVISALGCTIPALAQTPRFDELVRLHTTLISGAERPQDIPRSVVVRSLANSVGRLQLAKADTDVLKAWIDELRLLIDEQSRRSKENYRQRCEEIGAGQISALTLIDEEVAAEARRDAAIVSSYESAYDVLSPQGKNSLDAFINTSIMPSLQHIVIDHRAIALVDDAVATKVIALTCDAKLNSTPEQIRERVEAARRRQGTSVSAPQDGDPTGTGVIQSLEQPR